MSVFDKLSLHFHRISIIRHTLDGLSGENHAIYPKLAINSRSVRAVANISVLSFAGFASTREKRSGGSSDKNRMISNDGGKRRNIRRLNVYGHLGQLFRAQRYMNK